MLHQYRYSAKRRGLEWRLTNAEFRKLVTSECVFCGRKRSNTVRRGTETFRYNGIDRWDTTQGHTNTNSKSCCRTCNWMKGTLSAEAFVSAVAAIASNQIRKAA